MPPEPVSQSHLTAVLVVGTRVVIRSLLPESEVSADGPHQTDVVGVILSIDDDAVVVDSRRGQVRVPRARIVLAKRVPPPPPRRAPRRSGATPPISVDDLQSLMTAGMPPLRSQRVGEWLLRAADGYTGRANSALPIGDPGLPLDVALERLIAWYADQHLPALIQLPHATESEPTESALGPALAQRNWRFFQRTLVMVTPALTTGRSGPRIEVSSVPTDAWWEASSPRSIEHRATLTQVLARIPAGAYLTAYLDDRPAGHARLAFHDGWSGVFDVHTDPAVRRRGVGRALMGAAEQLATDERIPLQYLQVSADNSAAVRLYESLGWQTHHAYHYATPADPHQD